MLRKFHTQTGVFNVFITDTAFVECFSKGQAWEKDIIDKFCSIVPEKGTILDIGGHIGTHAIPYSLKRPDASVITFEPQKSIRDILERNRDENNAKNLKIMPYGVGHTNRHVHLANDFASDGYSKNIQVSYTSKIPVNFGGLGITNDPAGERIEIRSLDSLNLTDVIYIKIDVEGAETLVVYGAQETIRICKPILLIEQSDKNLTHLYENDFPDLKTFSALGFLTSIGYSRTDLGRCNYLYTYDGN
jgi:FkbM family methyltransferase